MTKIIKSIKVRRENNLHIYKFFLVIFSLTFAILSAISYFQVDVLGRSRTGFEDMQHIEAEMQRVTRFALIDKMDVPLIDVMTYQRISIYPLEEMAPYFEEMERLKQVLISFVDNWNDFKIVLTEYHETGDELTFFDKSQENYYISQSILGEVRNYIEKLISIGTIINRILLVNLFIIGLIIVRMLFIYRAGFYKTREVSQGMDIDISTGIYNRKKCQKVLKSTVVHITNKERAIVIFDLDEFAKSNRIRGHKKGDEMLSNFSSIVKKALKVLDTESFVGRYNADVFMVSLSSVNDKDVQTYINEVEYLVREFNDDKQENCEINFTSGYVVTDEETKEFLIRELFNLAERELYVNKLKKKERYKQGFI